MPTHHTSAFRMLALAVAIVCSPLSVAAEVAAQTAEPTAGASAGAAATAFPTPEGAVTAYLAGVASGDVDAILDASAIDESSAGFQFAAFADRLGALTLSTSLAPAEYPLYAAMNRVRTADRILSQVLMLAYGLLSDEEVDGRVIAPVDRARADAFVRDVDPSRLSDLAVMAIRFPDASLEQDERYLANAATQAAIHGADELTERLALLSFEGDLYDVGFTLMRFGANWKVAAQVSPLAGTAALGTARPTTTEEFDRQTAGE